MCHRSSFPFFLNKISVAFFDDLLCAGNGKLCMRNEDNLKIKGQGDRLEASSRIFAKSISIFDWEDGHFVGNLPSSSGLVRYEPAEQIPVFCLFTVFEKDCSLTSDGITKICLSKDLKDTVRTHFPEADTVAIIDDPMQFILDVVNSISSEVKHGNVEYFNIDKGYQRDDGSVAMDMDYMRYLMQDTPAIVEGNRKTLRFLEKYVYRCLFCKDNYFRDEQEYRIVLKDEKIQSSKVYQINFTKNFDVLDLNDFLNCESISIF